MGGGIYNNGHLTILKRTFSGNGALSDCAIKNYDEPTSSDSENLKTLSSPTVT